jgi:hypothetical protein
LLHKAQFFFQNLTLGYMTKTLNQIFFFLPPKSEYFFQQHWEYIWRGFVCLLVCFVWICVLCSWVLLYLIKLNNTSEHKLQAAWMKSYLE